MRDESSSLYDRRLCCKNYDEGEMDVKRKCKIFWFFRTFRAQQFQHPGKKHTQRAMRSVCIEKMIKAIEEAFLPLVRPYDTWLSVLLSTESAEEPTFGMAP
ncbi:hypothetical protein Krac_1485 [Ktedonobacter racemifer DSM 44963]|uniref:Uncharacterized protein n=1 Tax=Ktedonobacter racemifer DSM 44963 TaxID=485913 RepID=D6U1W9_KTERA|nr:hypothetical protein Krac_1485 [Ktedonobacter racemifer DSM 44963]